MHGVPFRIRGHLAKDEFYPGIKKEDNLLIINLIKNLLPIRSSIPLSDIYKKKQQTKEI